MQPPWPHTFRPQLRRPREDSARRELPVAAVSSTPRGGLRHEHIIVLGQRGLPDATIRTRLAAEELIFLTQDTEFEDLPADYRAVVIISRAPQSLPTKQRVGIWFAAIQKFLAQKPAGKLFDLLESGEIVPWEIRKSD